MKKSVALTAACVAAFSFSAVSGHSAVSKNTPKQIDAVFAYAKKLGLKSYGTDHDILGPDGASYYTCINFDDSTKAHPELFTKHFRYCYKQKGVGDYSQGKATAKPKAQPST